MNCEFPKSALLDLGNGKYSTIIIEYPWVPQNCSHCKIFGHSRLKCHVVKDMDTRGSERIICSDHNGIRPATGYVDATGSTPASGFDSDVADIGDLITTPVKTGSDKYIKVNVADNPISRGGNRACRTGLGRANSGPGQNRVGSKLALFFRVKILTAQPALKTWLGGPNTLFKVKKIGPAGPYLAGPYWVEPNLARFFSGQ